MQTLRQVRQIVLAPLLVTPAMVSIQIRIQTVAETPWHTMQIDAVVKNLGTNADTGLSRKEVENRLKKYGYNQLEEKEGVSPIWVFLEQFNDFIVWILLAAVIVSGVLKEWVDALAIFAIIIINAVIGFIQEYRAEKSLAALQK